MNATQPSRPPLQALPTARRTNVDSYRRQKRQSPHRRHRAIAVELSAKLVANVLLSVAALSALVRLLPYNEVQQARLQELKTELTQVEGRVDLLQESFNRYFDPQQSSSVMQEQGGRIAPGQRPIVWTTQPDFTPTSP